MASPSSWWTSTPKVGQQLGAVTVYHEDKLPSLVAEQDVVIGIITSTPPAAAQDAANTLVAAGVRSILNFGFDGVGDATECSSGTWTSR